MASVKGSKWEQEKKLMVAAKGMLNTGVNRVGGASSSNTSGVGNFEVYSEDEKVKVQAHSIRNSAPVKKGSALIGASNAKGVLNKMENSKGKDTASANTRVGRKALADVSNIGVNIQRNVVHDGSKSLKNERAAFLQRVSAGLGRRNVNVSRQNFTGKAREDTTQGVTDSHTLGKGIKNLKSASEDQQTKTRGRGQQSSVYSSRSTRNPPIPTRTSLPVFKRASQPDSCDSKVAENTERSGKAIDTGSSVKARVRKKVICQVSKRSQYWRNRASDGLIAMGPNVQTSMDTSKTSVKPIAKTASVAFSGGLTSKAKCTSALNKSKSVAPRPCKGKKGVNISLPKMTASSVVSDEAPQRKLTDPDSNSTVHSSGLIARKKSIRRRSYTSLLITRSKLLEEHGDILKQEELPSIDDECNQLEVAEYVDEIYQYYWIAEAQNPPLKSYMSIQTDISPHMRGILINWLSEVHYKFDLMPETLYLMVTLLDRYLSQVKIKKSELQLVGLTALLLASKYEDFWHPRIKDLISISAESYTRDQMLKLEKLMLKTLKFRLNMPTPYVFMLRFLKAAQSEAKLEHLAFYLIELSLVEYEALKFKPSLLCASAIYVARCTLQMTPAWTPLLSKHTRYDLPQIRDCAEMILRIQKDAKKWQLKVTYEKYVSPELSCAAAIKPIDTLPL